MTKNSICLLALIVSYFFNSPVFAANVSPFPDMDYRWFRFQEAVDYLVDRGVIAGYEDGSFKPDQTINRAELLKIVFKGKSHVTPISRRCFSDVNPDEWYAPYVCAAKQRGIVSGYPNGTFRPAEAVNTAEALKIILNAYDFNVKEAGGEEWYAPYVDALDSDDILPENSYIPWEPLTREHAADLLWRVLRYDEERIVPKLSAGCGKAEPVSVPRRITVNEEEREFLLTVPRRYVTHDPSPLIIAFHGRTNSNEQVRAYYGLDKESPDSFIAYPAARRSSSTSFTWYGSNTHSPYDPDIEMFDAVVQEISEKYCIDMDRISVVGHSLGAWMANSVACVRGDVVLSSSTVGGDGMITSCSGPAAAFIAHNPKDTLASFSGSERVLELRLKENSCDHVPENVPGTAFNCQRYSCTAGNDILFCPHSVDTFKGSFYPHQWPERIEHEIVSFIQSML